MSIHIKGELEIEVRDRQGRIKKRHKQQMKSFVRNFLKHLKCAFQEANETGLVDTSGNTVEIYHPFAGNYHFLDVKGGEGGATKGIVIGSGTTPPTNDDYKLESQYNTSVFSYSSTSITIVDEEGYVVLRIIRTFTNVSGSSKTINEVGLICRTGSPTVTNALILIARDVLSTPITVEDGESVVIRYVIKTMA